jgi:hypothetical protein
MGTHRHHHVIELFFQLLDLSLLMITPRLTCRFLVLREAVDLHIPHRLGEPLPGDGLGQLAAELGVALEDMGLDAVQGQMPGHGHARRAAADDGHPLAGGSAGPFGGSTICTARPSTEASML